jgi:hypothetical protein
VDQRALRGLEGAPAYWKAQARPTRPSPPTSAPRPVSQAESVTRSASVRTRSMISQASSNPLSAPSPSDSGIVRASAELSGKREFRIP